MERLICLLIGYVCGLFQTSYIIGRIYNTDIREHGSGNAGTTNALRTFGRKAGALTLLGDCLKCVAAMLIARAVFRGSCQDMLPLLSLYAATGCILGHNFPFYLGFRGGKGFAASVGMALVFDWRILLICAVVFFTIFFTTHYVSLGSMTCYLLALVLMVVFGTAGDYGMDAAHRMELYLLMGALTLMILVRHRTNIVRLLSGKENKIYLGKSGKKE